MLVYQTKYRTQRSSSCSEAFQQGHSYREKFKVIVDKTNMM